MKTIPITSKTRPMIAARLRAMRRVGAFAALSLPTIKALSTVEQRADSQLVKSIVQAGRTNDETTPELREHASRFAPSYVLSPAQRAEIEAARPGSRSIVFRQPVTVTEEPLPADFVPATVEDYTPIIQADAEIDAQAAREAAAEIEEMERKAVAVSFESDLDSHPVDYSPRVPKLAQVVPVPVALTEHETLRRRILGLS